MNRRDALKSLGLSLGYVVATPTILSMLQSCTAHDEKWKPLFFSDKQAYVLKNLVDLILPTTSTSPGALDVNVPQFIDFYTSETALDEAKDLYETGLDAIIEELEMSSTEPFHVEKEKFEGLLNKYLRLTPEQQLPYIEQEDSVFMTLLKIRDQSVWAYLTSQEVGENILAYDPIPGQQIGCMSLKEATDGKAWSL